MRYLNPKADLTVYKVFYEHPDLLVSFLNALLPFKNVDENIVSLEYLSMEQIPFNPFPEDCIIYVRCRDHVGRQFIVEMQMMWTSAYKQRVLFNASKAYVSQLDKGGDYELLQPVYSLNLVNDTFSEGEEYYHDFQIVEEAETKEVIEGLRFIFIELPKFTPHSYGDKKMQVLWLRYLTEINEKTREVPQELMENPEINKAVTQLEESAFSEAQLLGYDKFWDIISAAKMHISSATREGMEKGFKQGHEKGMKLGLEQGLEQGREEGIKAGREEGIKEGREEGIKAGREEGIKEGIQEERLKNARSMKAEGIPDETIARITGLPVEEITDL